MKRLLIALSFLTLGTAVACSDNTGPGASVAGNYSLQTVNGQSLPVRFCDVGGCLTVVSSQISLDASGNYSGTTNFRDDSGFPITDQHVGFWILSGSQIELVDNADQNNPFFGTVSGSQITIVEQTSTGQVTEVYTR